MLDGTTVDDGVGVSLGEVVIDSWLGVLLLAAGVGVGVDVVDEAALGEGVYEA